MTSPGWRLMAVTVACVVIGLAAVVAAWRNPDSDGFTVLATAPGWPWAWAALEGGLVWRRGRAMQAHGRVADGAVQLHEDTRPRTAAVGDDRAREPQ